jgi:hypothetical protein
VSSREKRRTRRTAFSLSFTAFCSIPHSHIIFCIFASRFLHSFRAYEQRKDRKQRDCFSRLRLLFDIQLQMLLHTPLHASVLHELVALNAVARLRRGQRKRVNIIEREKRATIRLTFS